MLRTIERVLPALTANQSDILALNAPFFAKVEGANADRDRRRNPHANRRNRGSYYVFRQGMLQMLVFDRQANGW
jgi:hypothetical protein